MTGLGRAPSTQTALSGWPKRQPMGAPARERSLRWGEEPRQKAQAIRDRLRLNGFRGSSVETNAKLLIWEHGLILHDTEAGLTCRDGLLQRLSGPRLQNELALLVRLQLLHLHGLGFVCCSFPAASLRHRVPHVTHLDTEGKLVAWDRAVNTGRRDMMWLSGICLFSCVTWTFEWLTTPDLGKQQQVAQGNQTGLRPWRTSVVVTGSHRPINQDSSLTLNTLLYGNEWD